tara:strand:- start:277 stop:1419 length:1143 start_codon:yes stop_codon:yes gene_type:complete
MNKLILTAVITLGSVLQGYGQLTYTDSLSINGINREFIVYVPNSYDSSIETPLLFNFHGFGSLNSNHMGYCDMRPIADTAGFILIYPQGSLYGASPHWNVGSWTYLSSANDLGFTETMIDTLAHQYNIDLNRVYSCGFSNGGYFSYVLACQLSSKIAAIGSVGGTMSTETFNACTPSRPVPVVSIHGTTDGTVSYYGGTPFNSKSQEDVLSYWTQKNNTDTSSTSISLPNTYTQDGSTVTNDGFHNGDSCVSVEHYMVTNGGHDWPGSWGNMDINASKIIWNFVSKYDLNGLITCNSISVSEHTIKTNINVFPNPTDGLVYFGLEQTKQCDYIVYSITGEPVQHGKLNKPHNSIDLSNLPSSWYIIQLENTYYKVYKRNY